MAIWAVRAGSALRRIGPILDGAKILWGLNKMARETARGIRRVETLPSNSGSWVTGVRFTFSGSADLSLGKIELEWHDKGFTLTDIRVGKSVSSELRRKGVDSVVFEVDKVNGGLLSYIDSAALEATIVAMMRELASYGKPGAKERLPFDFSFFSGGYEKYLRGTVSLGPDSDKEVEVTVYQSDIRDIESQKI